MNSVYNPKVACIQMDIDNCDKKVNIAKAMDMAKEALERGADILVFPEVFSTGFCYENMEGAAEEETGETIKNMCVFSEEEKCVLIFSILEKKFTDGELEYYNLGVCIEDGEIMGTYRKTHPFNKEKNYFSAGDGIHPIELKKRGLTIGLQICYEVRFPEVSRKLALEGSDILVTIAEFPAPRSNIWRALAIARAIENQMPHVACNRVGISPDSSYFGGSLIVDPLGEVKEEASDEETVISCSLEPYFTSEIRKKIPVFGDRRPELY